MRGHDWPLLDCGDPAHAGQGGLHQEEGLLYYQLLLRLIDLGLPGHIQDHDERNYCVPGPRPEIVCSL